MSNRWNVLESCTGFEWDEGNSAKNWLKHRVMQGECEQMFFNKPFVVSPDEAHSLEEARYYALGRTNAGRHIFIVFTIREERIRVISARDCSRRERRVYESQ